MGQETLKSFRLCGEFVINEMVLGESPITNLITK